MQLRATWGLLILEFWTLGQELLGKGCSQRLPLPPTSLPQARPALLLAAPVSSQAGPKVKAAG